MIRWTATKVPTVSPTALPPPRSAMPDRIDRTADGAVDDVVISDVKMFRMERTSSGTIWMALYRDGKPDIVFWLNSSRKITAEIESD